MIKFHGGSCYYRHKESAWRKDTRNKQTFFRGNIELCWAHNPESGGIDNINTAWE